MNRSRLFLEDEPKKLKIFILGYIVFAGSMMFPFRNDRIPLDLEKVGMTIFTYGILGLGLAHIYGKGKTRVIYILSLILTGLGMILRYLLEYGEVSNTINFIDINIISYILIIPIFITGVYYIKTYRT